jgi:DNA-binding NarL/FixJ family response regulator
VTIRVVIADDHAPTRLGVRMALEEAGFEVCGEAATAPAAVEAAVRERPDVALIDVHMPGNGIAAARQISALLPDTSIVVLTVSRDDEDLMDALQSGAKGYLLKDIDPRRLPLALQGVLDGEAALPRSLVAKLIDEFRHREETGVRPRGPLARLTSREWEVLDLMRQGRTTADIAQRLYVSPVTVRTHVSAILRKLQVPDREAAIRVAEGSARRPAG